MPRAADAGMRPASNEILSTEWIRNVSWDDSVVEVDVSRESARRTEPAGTTDGRGSIPRPSVVIRPRQFCALEDGASAT